MPRKYEVVDAPLVMEFVRRANPYSSIREIAEVVGRDAERIRRYQKPGTTMSFETADHLLSAFGLNYLLSTGDIPCWVKEVQHGNQHSFKPGGKNKEHIARIEKHGGYKDRNERRRWRYVNDPVFREKERARRKRYGKKVEASAS